MLLIGGFIRVWQMESRPLWVDELFSIHNAGVSSYKDLFTWGGLERNHPPLSFILMKTSMDCAGSNAAWVVRLLPCLAGTACIGVVFLIGSAMGSRLIGLWAAALATFDPLLVDQSAQARMFAYACLTSLCSLWLLV